MKTMREEAKQRFAENTENHTVDIRHDDGLYRHLVCSNEGSSVYRFDIVTYPGYLVVSGDMGEWVFSRVIDMFKFFRSPDGDINPGYWAEKCCAGNTTEFSDEKFIDAVTGYVSDYYEDDYEAFTKVMAAVQEDIFDLVEKGEENPYYCLNEFEYSFGGRMSDSPVFRFNQADMSEFSFSDYTLHFLWALHGIVWAINEYDRLKA